MFTKNDSLKLLFIGNSATYVNDLPGTLCRLASEAGYCIEAESVVRGGYTLTQHADRDSEHGRRVTCEIAKGYDVVFLQDNGNCISSDEKRRATVDACDRLAAEIRAAGSLPYIYVRPPYGIENFGFSPFEQCAEFDLLFGEIAERIGAVNACVNRAFARAIKKTDFDLWGPDHAHTGERGAYLAVCVFFSTLFGVSSRVLGTNGLPDDEAEILRSIADEIVLDGVIPW